MSYLDLETASNYFRELWKNERPIVNLFRTDSKGYLYDTGTNKIMDCDDVEHFLLEGFVTRDVDEALNKSVSYYGLKKTACAAQIIIKAIEKEHILLAKKATQFGLSGHYHNFEELTNSALKILVLETTENCNFRCNYCIYNPQYECKRNHGKKNMPISIGKASIDYLEKHSFRLDHIYISFYGGEPLLNIDFIRSCVEHARVVINKKKNVSYSITTNASLITPQIAKYLFKNKFSVTVSIDGPEEIHNNYRKDIKGEGTFKKTLKGLECLKHAFKESLAKRIILNMVYAPPFLEKKLNRIVGLWDEVRWLPAEITTQFTYPTPGTIPSSIMAKAVAEEDKSMLQWAMEKYWNRFIGQERGNPISNTMVEKELAILMKRPIFKIPPNEYNLNGCCVPAERRLFVSVEGNFHICERISTDAPLIGSIYSGVDKDVIKKEYINEYESFCLPLCSSCWAIRLCNACYVHAYNRGKLDIIEKKNSCNDILYSKERYLAFFCKLLERNQRGLNYLSNYDLN